jgi:hypothetical protein
MLPHGKILCASVSPAARPFFLEMGHLRNVRLGDHDTYQNYGGHHAGTGASAVPESVLEAIKQGVWDFEPSHSNRHDFSSTEALPGTDEKLAILADRVRRVLPLWHPSDRQHVDDQEPI